jgi:uncharacterized protein YuzE
MKARYDPDVDILYIRLSDAPIVDSESVEPNLVLDRDAQDNVVGIEVLWASRLAGALPMAITFEVVNAPAAAGSASMEAAPPTAAV